MSLREGWMKTCATSCFKIPLRRPARNGNRSARGIKKLFFRDVLSLEIWELPVLDATKEGLEYISK
jgi:hypothetical protein